MKTQRELLTTKDLTIGYPKGRNSAQILLSGLSLSVEAGELVCLLGENGSGKTSLLRTFAGMNESLCGEILLLGKPLSSYTPNELAKFRAIVLTEKINGAMLTGRELVAIGRHPYTDWRGQLNCNDRALISETLQLVGAEKLENSLFNQLSDGQKQKLLIARALAQEPRLLILDEPTAFLDLARRAEIMLLLKELTRVTGCAVIVATHDLDSALRVADRFWLIGSDGQLFDDAPESIVINGLFENAFSNTDLYFNYQSGSFEKHKETSLPIFVEGDGMIFDWTCRALKRLGYRVEDKVYTENIPLVKIVQNSTATTWQWEFHGDKFESTVLSTCLREISENYQVNSLGRNGSWHNKNKL